MAEQENSELSYLQRDDIGKVVAKGLAHLYQQQPKFPVDYLGKWFLNYASSIENEKDLQNQKQIKEELVKAHQEQIQQSQEREQQVQQTQQEDGQIDEQFEQKIVQHEYHNELIVDEFPEFLEKRKGLTGCYIGNYDYAVREIDENNEEEDAHLRKDDPKVINYIGYSQSQQQLMTGKTLPREGTITGKVFDEKPEQPEVQEGEPAPEPLPDYQYVPDLVKEPTMTYFRLPKLGAYLAVPLLYNSCLNEEAFNAGLEATRQYLADKAEKEQAREQKELEFQEALKPLEENGEDTTELRQQHEAEMAELQDPEEVVYQTFKKEYVVCCDTMGQDRQIEQKDIDYLEKFTKLFAQSWEDREKELLSQDIQRQIQYLNSLPANYTDLVEQLEEQEEQFAQDKEGNFAELKDNNEFEYNYELNCARLEKVREQLIDKTHQEYFLALKDFRIIRFTPIIQNILYLLGYKREEINIPNTHMLNWKLVRGKYINEQFFENLLNYNHKGSKPDQVPVYAKVNRISVKMEKIDQEEVNKYNITFGRLLKWLKYTCKLRKENIEIRRQKIAQRKEDREKKIEKNAEINAQKEEQLETKRAEFAEQQQQQEDVEPFDEEAWIKDFDEANPLEVIPDEVEDEEDNDCEFDE